GFGLGEVLALGVDFGARGHRRPAFEMQRRLFRLGLVEAVAPWHGRRSLAAGMGKLDADGSALAMQEIDDAGEGSDLLVLPQTQIAITDATLRHDACRLEDDQAET